MAEHFGDHMVFRRSGGEVGDQSSPTEYKRGVTHVENRPPKGRGERGHQNNITEPYGVI